MENIKIEGIVLSSIVYKETSKIVYIYTKNGRISVRALGSLKQKRGMLPLITTMNRVEAIITNKAFPSAIDYTLIDSYDNIKSDLKKELWFSFMLEIVSKLTDDSPHERIYNLLIRMFDLASTISPLELGVMFQVKMMYGFGVAPILKKCAICGNEEVRYFSIRDGGAICMNHNHQNSFDNDVLNDIKKIYFFDIYNGNFDDIKDIDYIRLFRVVNIYYDSHINITLKGINSLIF